MSSRSDRHARPRKPCGRSGGACAALAAVCAPHHRLVRSATTPMTRGTALEAMTRRPACSASAAGPALTTVNGGAAALTWRQKARLPRPGVNEAKRSAAARASRQRRSEGRHLAGRLQSRSPAKAATVAVRHASSRHPASAQQWRSRERCRACVHRDSGCHGYGQRVHARLLPGTIVDNASQAGPVAVPCASTPRTSRMSLSKFWSALCMLSRV